MPETIRVSELHFYSVTWSLLEDFFRQSVFNPFHELRFRRSDALLCAYFHFEAAV